MLKMAVWGPGNISRRIMEGMKHVENAKVTAFCTRNPEKVREYAEAYGVEKLLSEEEMLKDKEIEAVYVSTPQHIHYDCIKKCLLNGKHVISEKPIVITTEQLRELHKLADEKGLMLMEAQKCLFVPVFNKISEWLREERIGRVHLAEADFARVHNIPLESWHMQADGKGALYDIGCYCLSELFGLFGYDYDDILVNNVHYHDVIMSSAVMMKKKEMTMIATCSFGYQGNNDLRIYGEKGTIICHEFWKSRECKLITDKEEVYRVEFPSEFTFEIQHFVDCINEGRTNSPVNTPEMSLKVTEILEKYGRY